MYYFGEAFNMQKLNRFQLDLHIGLIAIVCLTISSFSCTTDKSELRIELETLKPVDSISQLTDTIFITDDLEDIFFTQQKYIVADSRHRGVILMNESFQIESEILFGDGPGEVSYTYQIYASKERIYISDYGKNVIHRYNITGEYIDDLKPPKIDFMSFIKPFGVSANESFYLQSLDGEFPIIKFNANGELSNQFGKWLSYDSEAHKRIINTRHLHVNDNDELINIYTSAPLIELWSDEEDLMSTLDLADILDFRVEYYNRLIEENPDLKERLAFTYFEDTYPVGNKIYILYIGDIETKISNDILVINTNSGLSIEKIIHLDVPGAFFKEIAIVDETIYAYDKDKALLYKF